MESHRCVLLLRYLTLPVTTEVNVHELWGLPSLLRGVGCLSSRFPLYIVPSTLMLELIERLLGEGCADTHEH